MTPSELFAGCAKGGNNFGNKATEYALMLDELEERVWLAQEDGVGPPLWVTIMISVVAAKLGSVMGDAE